MVFVDIDGCFFSEYFRTFFAEIVYNTGDAILSELQRFSFFPFTR